MLQKKDISRSFFFTIKKTVKICLNGSNNKSVSIISCGDAFFFQKMYARYYEPLCIYAINYNSNRMEAEDVVQDTFLFIWSNRKKIVISSSLNSYLYRVVHNKLIDNYRQKKRMDEKLLSYYAEAINKVVTSDESYIEERIKQLDKCMNELPKRCRKVFYEKKMAKF